jgi:hypothetical protein
MRQLSLLVGNGPRLADKIRLSHPLLMTTSYITTASGRMVYEAADRERPGAGNVRLRRAKL